MRMRRDGSDSRHEVVELKAVWQPAIAKMVKLDSKREVSDRVEFLLPQDRAL